jgi:hypothetical protein
VEVEQEKLSK